MKEEYSKEFKFTEIENKVNQKWLKNKKTISRPDEREDKFVVMMPLPNVTGALHMGHAIDNVMQDLLTRWNKMKGYNTLWMPGTDHAGIATQAVVEKRIFELEGKTRHDIGKEGLVKRIWKWKDEYEKRIIKQQQTMGCSCDWTLHRFTMDEVCKRAVKEAFFRLFSDGLIFRGNRLVNWDCHLQTAISDDEIVRKTTQGNFWHINYPIQNPTEGEPEFLSIATTRPETMLGDTAVAIHPDPESAINKIITDTELKLKKAGQKEKTSVEEELNQLNKRKKTHLPQLLKLVKMAKNGKKIILPLMKREIPLILDEWAKPDVGSGCVKITPAHDPNDYEVWQRHKEEIDIINLLNLDGTYNSNAGKYAGKDRMEVRKTVLADLKKENLLIKTEEREIELGLSDRSKTPVEPYLSKQWFVNMSDQKQGVLCGKGTGNEFSTPGLAQAAIDAADPSWKSKTNRNLTFHPDSERYKNTFTNWLSEKRDWCISRQLWWGHQIPIWHGEITKEQILKIEKLEKENEKISYWISDEDGSLKKSKEITNLKSYYVLVCLGSEDIRTKHSNALEKLGLKQDHDVLDTWFSSALWPFSTLGWPNPETAEVGENHHPLGSQNGKDNFLKYYYPGSCLCTARDIITLWVARMTIFGLYFMGDVPFTDCFIHATIQDGKGERMSKSKGNGIDPIDIIEEFGADAMRYVLCDMQTGSQDIKLPVQAKSPFTGKLIDLAAAKHGQTIFTYIDPENGKEFDVLGTIPSLPKAKITSKRFDLGKAFCIKLWNAARFALLNLEGYQYTPLSEKDLTLEDTWILSRLTKTIQNVNHQLDKYNPSAAIGTAREFFWSEFCDWYLEIIKPRMQDEKTKNSAQTVLALIVDQILRLFHPFVPYITEALWDMLNSIAKTRGLFTPLPENDMLISAEWPVPQEKLIDNKAEETFKILQDIIRSIRELRLQAGISPKAKIDAVIKLPKFFEKDLNSCSSYIHNLVNIDNLSMGEDLERPPLSSVAIINEIEIYLTGLIDPEQEKVKLNKQKEKLNKALKGLEGRLKNPGFVNKAPAHVVESEKKKLEELKSQISKIEENLKQL